MSNVGDVRMTEPGVNARRMAGELQNLRLIVRTPKETVLETGTRSIRVMTETGQVGLRPLMEPTILAIQPGLILVHRAAGILFVGTAGGLLDCDGVRAILLTPLAVAAEDQARVILELEKQLEHPKAEMEVRTLINNIQSNILSELTEDRRNRSAAPGSAP